ncbi:MAG: 5-oxoprolinase subunit PxpB, partial [Alphaproteobacteria bacterium]
MKSVAGQDENMNQSVNAPEADWPRWLYAGDTALILEFGNTVHPSINAKVLAMATSIKKHKILGFVEAVPAFRSISIYFDPLVTDHEQVKLACTELPLETAANLKPANVWQIPVCYDSEFGLDLEETANVLDIGVDEVIQRHVDSDFRVYVLGFMPGFSFLGGLDKTLNLPRRKSPRKLVPRGSVAIAMGLGGVYPFDSPGGWHLLGKSPVKMYDGNREPAIFFEPGDG